LNCLKWYAKLLEFKGLILFKSFKVNDLATEEKQNQITKSKMRTLCVMFFHQAGSMAMLFSFKRASLVAGCLFLDAGSRKQPRP